MGEIDRIHRRADERAQREAPDAGREKGRFMKAAEAHKELLMSKNRDNEYQYARDDPRRTDYRKDRQAYEEEHNAFRDPAPQGHSREGYEDVGKRFDYNFEKRKKQERQEAGKEGQNPDQS